MIGWREWLSLPDFGNLRVKAKIDTGARSSSLHTSHWEAYETDSGEARIRFSLPPASSRFTRSIGEYDCPLLEFRTVRNSGGQEESRPFICIPVSLGPHLWKIDLSLTNRQNMLFPMLLGRVATSGRFTVDPASSYKLGSKNKPRHA